MSRGQILLRWALVLLVFVAGSLSCLALRINDNAMDLLPGEAVKGSLQLLQEMGLVDRVYITLSVAESFRGTGDDAKKSLLTSAEKLGHYLEESGRFSFVLAKLPAGYEYKLFQGLQKSLPFLLGKTDFEQLESQVSVEGVRERLQQAFSLLNSPAGIALKKQIQLDPLGLVPLALTKLNQLRSEFSMQLSDGVFFSENGRNCLIIAESISSLTDSAEALKVQDILDTGFRESLSDNVEARVIGSLPHTLANSRIIQSDLQHLLPLASFFLVVLLVWTLRDFRAFLVLAVPFLAAPPAIALTSLIHGELSGLALGFGIVLLGIGVDFSVHLFLTLKLENGSSAQLMQRVRRPILNATLTTSGVFVVLLFSSVASHRQMAVLALSGILLAVIFAWHLIPTFVIPNPGNSEKSPAPPPFARAEVKVKYSRILLLVWVCLVAAGAATWPQLRYNGDLRVLDVPVQEVKDDENHFSSIWGEKGDQAFVIVRAETLAELLDRNSRVFELLQTNEAIDFQSFAPILPGPQMQAQNYQRWQAFWEAHRPVFEQYFIEAAQGLGFRATGFDPFFSWLDDEPSELTADQFLGGPLEPLFGTMLSQSTAPENGGGHDYLAMTTVALTVENGPLLLQLQSQVEQVTVLNNSKWRNEIESLMRTDIILLSSAAALVILTLIIIQFRNILAVIAVLAPVVTALSAMSVFCYFTGRELNMMHLIMTIMVIGLSVDYGIFIVCSKQMGQGESSIRAVSICAASSLIGFGVLAFATHPALHALGTTVLVGIGVAWPTALFISPQLLGKPWKI